MSNFEWRFEMLAAVIKITEGKLCLKSLLQEVVVPINDINDIKYMGGVVTSFIIISINKTDYVYFPVPNDTETRGAIDEIIQSVQAIKQSGTR